MKSDWRSNIALVGSLLGVFLGLWQSFKPTDTDVWGATVDVPVGWLIVLVVSLAVLVWLIGEWSRRRGYNNGMRLSQAEVKPLWDRISELERELLASEDECHLMDRTHCSEIDILCWVAKEEEISDDRLETYAMVGPADRKALGNLLKAGLIKHVESEAGFVYQFTPGPTPEEDATNQGRAANAG